MLALRRHRDFRLVWAGDLVSVFGDWFLILAVPVHVYAVTGSPVATGLVYAAQNVPAILVGPIAGVIADRVDRRRLMAVADGGRAALLAGMTLATSHRLLWLLLAGAVLERGLAQFHAPAAAALVPNLVGTGPELTSANAAFHTSGGIARLVAAPVGGALFVAAGLTPLLVIDGLTFAVSFTTTVAIRWRGGTDHPTEGAARPGFVADLRDGIGHVRRHGTLRWLTLTIAAFLFCNGALSGQLVPFAIDRLDGSATAVGLLLSGLGAGYLVGASAATVLTAQRPLTQTVPITLAVVGAGFLVLFTAESTVIAVAGAVFAGAGGSIALITAAAARQRATPDHQRARVTSAAGAVLQAAQLAGTVTGALAVPVLGLAPTLYAGSVGVLVAAAVAHRTRRFVVDVPDPQRDRS